MLYSFITDNSLDIFIQFTTNSLDNLHGLPNLASNLHSGGQIHIKEEHWEKKNWNINFVILCICWN